MEFKNVFSPAKNQRYNGAGKDSDSTFKNMMSSKESVTSGVIPNPQTSPDMGKLNQCSSDYFSIKNIGRIQPIYEIKSIINEQLIRAKLNRGNNKLYFKNGDYSSVLMGNSGIQSEVVSPKNSPLNNKVVHNEILINHDFLKGKKDKNFITDIFNLNHKYGGIMIDNQLNKLTSNQQKS
mmetsp:Transcript_139/g.151  ORF Transcript_139/g.151 Transcript_139/m.151 type:complete len:179 (+) Transcript_139:1101-1637(+)|eukprot:CAMPEP_0170549902 /NCGR_PEP_ID=MMETSP0211-20121228/8005_1 /TAXON_ID=311385 /ORGANISM="Pseudokeronopsis sp., Strain OXSARD2" /LENGTH=178 /DNA_ID=CAMNT_0010856153 /DNA_START=998 /DNA_END=1534 /DNA_ORIENTATION=+